MNEQALEEHYPLFDKIIDILPGAIIAGGFLRDTLMDKPVRDMDILYTKPLMPEQAAALTEVLNTTIAPTPDYERTEDYKGEEQPGDRQSFPQSVYKAWGVDIIIVPDVVAHVKDFPDDISKVWYGAYPDNTDNCLWATSEFIYAHANKQLKYRITAPTARLEKLKAKYPDYTVVYKGCEK